MHSPFPSFNQLPYRNEIKARLTKLWDYEKYGTPFSSGVSVISISRITDFKTKSVLYKLQSLEGEPTVLIDPNRWSADGTNALGGLEFSGRWKPIGLMASRKLVLTGAPGKSWMSNPVNNFRDELNWIKFGSVSWTKDSKGFYYSCYDEPKSDEKFQGLNLGQKVYYHRIGDPQSKRSAHSRKFPKIQNTDFYLRSVRTASISLSQSGRVLTIVYRVLYQNLDDPNSKLKALIENFENEYSFLGNDGSNFYFKF